MKSFRLTPAEKAAIIEYRRDLREDERVRGSLELVYKGLYYVNRAPLKLYQNPEGRRFIQLKLGKYKALDPLPYRSY